MEKLSPEAIATLKSLYLENFYLERKLSEVRENTRKFMQANNLQSYDLDVIAMSNPETPKMKLVPKEDNDTKKTG